MGQEEIVNSGLKTYSIQTLNLDSYISRILQKEKINTLGVLIDAINSKKLIEISGIDILKQRQIEFRIIQKYGSFLEVSDQGKIVDPVTDEIEVLDKSPIEVLGFTTRVNNALKRAGIFNIHQLILAHSHNRLNNIMGLGKKSIIDISNKLSRLKIDFPDEKNESENELLKDSTPLTELGLENRVRKSLERAGIDSVGYLLWSHRRGNLMNIRNIGKNSIKDIEEKLSSFLSNDGELFNINESSANITKINLSSFYKTIYIDDIMILISKTTKSKLLKAGCNTLLDIKNQLVDLTEKKLLGRDKSFFEEIFVLSRDDLIAYIISAHKRKINMMINEGRLHANAKYLKVSLNKWLEGKSNKLIYLRRLSKVFERNSLAEDIEKILGDCDEREKLICIFRFGLKKKTLNNIAKEFDVTRERIRQIENASTKKIRKAFSREEYIYFQSAIAIGNSFRENLSIPIWKDEIIKRKILGFFSGNFSKDIPMSRDVFNIFLLLINEKFKEFLPPIQVIEIAKKANGVSVKNYNQLIQVPKVKNKKLKKMIIFKGGISIKEASKCLELDSETTRAYLNYKDYVDLGNDWFSMSSFQQSKKIPLRNSGQKMLSVCNPIKFTDFRRGLLKHINRFFPSLAPNDVLKYTLVKLGFIIDGDFVRWEEKNNIQFSKSEKIFISLSRKKGLVLLHSEVVEAFLENDLSLPAASALLSRSPIIYKIETGLYSLRGVKVDWEDISNAKDRIIKIETNAKISHGTDGIIRYQININNWGKYTGVVSISQLPDLGSDWKVLVGKEQCGKASMANLLLWGLSNAFEILKIDVQDRIELCFNTFNRSVEVKKIDESVS